MRSKCVFSISKFKLINFILLDFLQISPCLVINGNLTKMVQFDKAITLIDKYM